MLQFGTQTYVQTWSHHKGLLSSFPYPPQVWPRICLFHSMQWYDINCLVYGVFHLHKYIQVHNFLNTTKDLSKYMIHPALNTFFMLLLNPLMRSRTQNNISWWLGLSSFLLRRIHSPNFPNHFPIIIPTRKKGGGPKYFSLLYIKLTTGIVSGVNRKKESKTQSSIEFSLFRLHIAYVT